MRDLKVIRRVSFCWPQPVPANARRRLRRGVARVTREAKWEEKVNLGSSVTPSIVGFLLRGRMESLRATWGWVLVWWGSEEKSVTLDLGREIESPLSHAHSATWAEWAERALAAVGTSGEE